MTTPIRGKNFIDRIFATEQALVGGPVRRAMSTIVRNASLASTLAEAKRRGWSVYQLGGYWYFFDVPIRFGRVVGTVATLPFGRSILSKDERP